MEHKWGRQRPFRSPPTYNIIYAEIVQTTVYIRTDPNLDLLLIDAKTTGPTSVVGRRKEELAVYADVAMYYPMAKRIPSSRELADYKWKLLLWLKG